MSPVGRLKAPVELARETQRELVEASRLLRIGSWRHRSAAEVAA